MEWADELHLFYGTDQRTRLEFLLTRKLVLASRRWAVLVDEAIKHQTGYRRAQWQALFVLAISGEPLPTVELSVRLSLAWPSLLRTLGELENKGLIARETDREDRRLRIITITPAGIDLVRQIQQIMDPLRQQLLGGLPDADLETGNRVLDHILDNLLAR